MIPFIDLRPQNEVLRSELEAALGRVLDSGAYTLGPEVERVRSEFAAWSGVPHAVAMNSGTTALHLALLAAGIGPGDDVITTPFTFIATACAIRYVGANPVFADIDFATRNLDPEAVAKALTPRTRAILPVHLYGQTADMDPLRALAERHGLVVIEDAAQAHGASHHGVAAGGLGALGCFSFYPTKNLGALGEGGLVTTRDATLADALRLLRDWGAREKYQHEIVAYNARMDAFQGAVLRVKLRRLTAWNEERRAIAARYAELLAGDRPRAAARSARLASRLARLHRARAGARARRSVAQGAGRRHGRGLSAAAAPPAGVRGPRPRRGQLPRAERAARELLGLPMYPGLPKDGPERVVAALAKALGR